jgi:hypothetical protein
MGKKRKKKTLAAKKQASATPPEILLETPVQYRARLKSEIFSAERQVSIVQSTRRTLDQDSDAQKHLDTRLTELNKLLRALKAQLKRAPEGQDEA